MSDPDWKNHCGDLWRAHVFETVGFDICDAIGPLPRRPSEWVAMMRRVGGRSMCDVVTFVHGASIPPLQARRGDIVQSGWALGVCRGELAEFYGSEMRPIGVIMRAWCIG